MPGNANDFKSLTAETCKNLEPLMFVFNHNTREKPAPEVLALLDTIDPRSFVHMTLPREKGPALHYHECDEYWGWTKGRTLVTIRLPDGRSDSVEIGPGWVVYCVRGVEHGHEPLEDWGAFEWKSVLRPGARRDMLYH